jgi:hypothetical protein
LSRLGTVVLGIVTSRNGRSRNGRVRNGRSRIGRSRNGTSTVSILDLYGQKAKISCYGPFRFSTSS